MTPAMIRRRLIPAAAATAAAALAGLGVTVPPSAVADTAGVTVAAPGAGAGAAVTVSSTTNLVNQTVRVSWTGFRPSSSTILNNAGDSVDETTENPVRVYECRGSSAQTPSGPSDCYGAPGFRGIVAQGDQPAIPASPGFTYPGQQDAYDALPDGPANFQDAVTGADGTGEVSIQLFTKTESSSLGCDARTPCSIVVVPNYGRPEGDTEDLMDAPWAWARRTVVPLSFLPTGDTCPLAGSSISVEGSPMAADLLASWRAKTCTLPRDSAVRLDYTAIGEPQTREDVGSATNLGLTIDPLTKEEVRNAAAVYAPVSVTSLVVAYQIDDAQGRPVRNLRLSPRLVAKLITASYRTGVNPATLNNPVNLFHDPEFLALNPGIDFPSGTPGNHPLLLGDLSDTTLALTRWIQADKDARAFLDGTPDPWGMHVNTNYQHLALPIASFPSLDQAQADFFQPVQELDALARQLSIAQFPGGSSSVENGVTVVSKPPRQNPGRREIIGIGDAASAANFRLSTASLLNAGGAYVAPTDASVLAGIAHSKANPDKVTRSVNLSDTDRSIYPLSLLVSAAVSTKAPKADRTSINHFLDYVAGAGQVPGDKPGQLPAGYAPLTPSLVKQVRVAQKAIAKGFAEPKAKGKPKPAAAAAPSATAGGSVPSSSAAEAAPSTTAVKAAADVRTQVKLLSQRTSIPSQPLTSRLLALPALLLAALLSLLVGPGLVLLGRSKRVPAWLRR